MVTQISVHMQLEVDGHRDVGNLMPLYYIALYHVCINDL